MSYFKIIILDEHQRLQALYQKYTDKIDSLPKGAVSIKSRNNNNYLYLARRQHGKLKFYYIGSVGSENARKVLKQVKFRKEFELKLKQVKEDLREIENLIHGRKNELFATVLRTVMLQKPPNQKILTIKTVEITKIRC